MCLSLVTAGGGACLPLVTGGLWVAGQVGVQIRVTPLGIACGWKGALNSLFNCISSFQDNVSFLFLLFYVQVPT